MLMEVTPTYMQLLDTKYVLLYGGQSWSYGSEIYNYLYNHRALVRV
jgi:hypothetical protein